MTHMWKSCEVYTFDIPTARTTDIYGKNPYMSLETYLKMRNPKITKVRFDEKHSAVHIEVGVPKYPEESPYFSEEECMNLLSSYMDYANSSIEELRQTWFNV